MANLEAWLHTVAHRDGIDLSLDRLKRALLRLKHPEAHIPPTVHVAGTNGKGSVLAFCHAILKAEGYRVHAYTSPHLVTLEERFVVAGDRVTRSELTATLSSAYDACQDLKLTHFEWLTLAAFMLFAKHPADVLLLETGMGGRLDATNVIASPRATVMTSIGFDHSEFLGSTLAAIAREKAGIMKAGTPCVVGPVSADVAKVFEQHARTLNVPLFLEGRDWFINYKDRQTLLNAPFLGINNQPLDALGLQGDHQKINAALAIMALGLARISYCETSLAQGLAAVHWPARLQQLPPQFWEANVRLATVGTLPDVWLDGAHNPDGARVVAHFMRTHGPQKPWQVIVGMMARKASRPFLHALKAGGIDHLWTIPIPDVEGCFTPSELAACARELGLDATPTPTLEAALQQIVTSGGTERIMITGSLYLAGSVLKKMASL